MCRVATAFDEAAPVSDNEHQQRFVTTCSTQSCLDLLPELLRFYFSTTPTHCAATICSCGDAASTLTEPRNDCHIQAYVVVFGDVVVVRAVFGNVVVFVAVVVVFVGERRSSHCRRRRLLAMLFLE